MKRFKVSEVPVRLHSRGLQSRLGLDRLEVGQSVLIPRSELEPREDDAPGQPLKRVRAMVSAAQRRYRLTNEDGSVIFIRRFRTGIPDRYGVRIVRVQ